MFKARLSQWKESQGKPTRGLCHPLSLAFLPSSVSIGEVIPLSLSHLLMTVPACFCTRSAWWFSAASLNAMKHGLVPQFGAMKRNGNGQLCGASVRITTCTAQSQMLGIAECKVH